MVELIQVKIPKSLYDKVLKFLKIHKEYGFIDVEHFVRSSLRFPLLLKEAHIDVTNFLSPPLQVQVENDNHTAQPSYQPRQ